jgi:hypothetical protein
MITKTSIHNVNTRHKHYFYKQTANLSYFQKSSHYPSIHPSTYLSIYLSIYLPIYLSSYLSIYLSMALQPFVEPWPLFQFLDLFTQSAGLLGWGISLLQGRYLHTGQHNYRISAHRYPCLKWDSNPRSQSLKGRREFISHTPRALWLAAHIMLGSEFSIICHLIWKVLWMKKHNLK